MSAADELTHYMEATARHKKRADEAEARASEVAKEIRDLPREGLNFAYLRRRDALADRLEGSDDSGQEPR